MDTLFQTNCVSVDGNVYTFQVTLELGHRVYKGHFPQQAVLPGVCMLQMITSLASDSVKIPLVCSFINQVKFLSVVIPDKTADLNVKITINPADEEQYSFSASIYDADCQYLGVKGVFKPLSAFQA